MNDDCVVITGLKYFSISQVFDCGQCFRFDSRPDGSFSGIALSKSVRFKQEDDVLYIYNISREEYDSVWKYYLSLDTDYGRIRDDILYRFNDDETIRKAMDYGSGIRILRQDPWETICSFIISQNNNIPRIKKIISRMCEKYGIEIDGGYTFPSPEVLYDAGLDGLADLKMGFRAKYVLDAAEKVMSKQVDFDRIRTSDTPIASELLREIKGVGLKVASCALLFGFEKTDAFPVDVWMRRVLEKYYPNGLDISSLGKYAGIAQQYLFYFERYTNIGKGTSAAFG